MSTGTVLRVRAGMKPIATDPARPAHGRRRHRRGRAGAPPAVGCLRGPRGRRRGRGDGRARARERRAREVRRRLGAPRPAATSSRTSRRSPSAPHRGRVGGACGRSCLTACGCPCPSCSSGRWARASRGSGSGSRHPSARRFVDTDAPIAERYGPIDEIFDREGEEYFRDLEREAVAEALREEAVISLGGGAVLHPRHARRPRRPARRVLTRLARGGRAAAHRRHPAAARGGRHRRAGRRSSRRARRSTSEVADVDIDTSRRSVARIVDEITERFRGGAR